MASSTQNDESPGDKFRRLAAARTRRILRDLEILGNCSNRTNYSYGEVDVDKIFDRIDSKIVEVKSRFSPKERNPDFEL
jgi:hypothetical protein